MDIGRRSAPVVGSDDFPIGVASHPPYTVANIFQTVENRSRHRTGGHVSADDQQVVINAFEVSQHRFESRQIPVHVVNRRDPRNLLHRSNSFVTRTQGPTLVRRFL